MITSGIALGLVPHEHDTVGLGAGCCATMTDRVMCVQSLLPLLAEP